MIDLCNVDDSICLNLAHHPTANSLASGSLDRVDVPSLTTNLTTFDESNGMDHATSHAPNGSSVNLPTGWMHIADPDGRPFYYNLLTKQSQWQAPLQDVM